MKPLLNKHGDQVFVQGLLDRPMALMSNDMSMCLINLSMAEKQEETPAEAQKMFDEDPGCQIISNRLNQNGGEATPETIMFCSVLCDGIPGRLVMWAYTLYRIFKLNGDKKVDLMAVCEKFHSGFPTAEVAHEAWEQQKAEHLGLDGYGNVLDKFPWEQLCQQEEVEAI